MKWEELRVIPLHPRNVTGGIKNRGTEMQGDLSLIAPWSCRHLTPSSSIQKDISIVFVHGFAALLWIPRKKLRLFYVKDSLT